MPPKTKKPETVQIRPFTLDKISWWAGYKHITILNGKLISAAGGEPTEEEWQAMKEYLNNKNIKFT